jgi:hypothetical protein
MKLAGIKNFKPEVEPIRYLVDRFEKDVDLARAAAELGVVEQALHEKADKNEEFKSIVSRMSGRGIPRTFFIDSYRQMRRLIDLDK